MTRSLGIDHDGEGLHPTISGGSRRWVDAGALWLVAVGAQALILFLLAQYQLQQAQTFKLQTVVGLISDGDLSSAQRYGAETDFLYYPTEVLIQFALVGLAIVMLAWVGRRSLAWTLPFGIAALSISPAYVSQVTAVRWTAVPAAVVAVIALATLELPTGSQLYTVPLAAVVLTLLAGAIATGAGGTWQRLGTAVAVPAFIAPIIMPIDTTNTRQDVALGLMVAAVSTLLVLAILALPSLTRRAKRLDAPTGEGMVPLAP